MTSTLTSEVAGRSDDIDAIVDVAAEAAREFRKLDQEQVDAIVEAMVRAGLRAAAELASVAIEETGFGVFEDKVVKNYVATEFLHDYLRGQEVRRCHRRGHREQHPLRRRADRRGAGHHPGHQPDVDRAVQGDRRGQDPQRGAFPSVAVRDALLRAQRRDPARSGRSGRDAARVRCRSFPTPPTR